MGQRRRFTPEFKRQAVQLLNAGQRTAAETVRELGGDVMILIVLHSQWTVLLQRNLALPKGME